MIKVEGKSSQRFWRYRWRSVVQPVLIGVLITVAVVPTVVFLKRGTIYPVDDGKPFAEKVYVVRAVSVPDGREKEFHYAGQIELGHVAVVGVSQTPVSPGEAMVASYRMQKGRVDYSSVVLTPAPPSQTFFTERH